MASNDRRTRLIEFLRITLRDQPQYNRLTGESDFTPDELGTYLELAMMDFNVAPPIIQSYTIESFPADYTAILVMGGALKACQSDAIREARNPFSFSDGVTSVQPGQKPGLYRGAIESLRMEYEQARNAVKVQINISGGWGGVSSDYEILDSFDPF